MDSHIDKRVVPAFLRKDAAWYIEFLNRPSFFEYDPAEEDDDEDAADLALFSKNACK